jgi:hypothetical protein
MEFFFIKKNGIQYRVWSMEEEFTKRIHLIQQPINESSLKSTVPIRVKIFRNESDLSNPINIEIKDVPLYYTVDDFALLFWDANDQQNDYAPNNVFFGIPQNGEDPATTWYVNLKSLTYAGKEKEVIGLKHPYRRRIYQEYVDRDGALIDLKTYNRRKISLEDIFYGDANVPTIHAYLINGVIQSFGDTISQKEKNGAIYPFYETDGVDQVSKAKQDKMEQVIERLTTQRNTILYVLENTPVAEEEKFKAIGIKQISYLWSEKPAEFPGVDMIFYNCDVNKKRPFMRYYPRSGTVMNKLYQPNPLEEPYINDPILLRSWAAEKSPSGLEDFLVMKTEIQHADPPIYASFRVNGDGSADYLMIPPKTVRTLHPTNDLTKFYRSIKDSIDGTTFHIEDAQFYRGSFVYELTIPDEMKRKITPNVILGHINRIKRYFEQIGGEIETDDAFLVLRYRAVSNYAKEGRVELFISEWIKNDNDIQSDELIETLTIDLGISETDARDAVKAYIEKRGDFSIADEEDKHFVATYNRGIDIYIYYDKFNKFTFHIYRVDSLSHLQRLCTLLKLLFLSSESSWSPWKKTEEEQAEVEEEGEDDIGSYGSNNSFAREVFQKKPQEEKPVVPEVSEEEKLYESAEKFQLKTTITTEFFMNNLKKVDKNLVDYGTKSKTKVESYSTKCQVNAYRQPFALTPAQFEQVRKIYAEDLKTDMTFIIYGTPTYKDDIRAANKMISNMPKGTKYAPDIISLLRYGSDKNSINYYVCAEYVCVKDNIFIRKRDFKNNKKRNGEPKQGIDIKNIPESEWDTDKNKGVGSCPFCGGTLIKKKDNPGLGETVFQRLPHVSKEPKLQIDFLEPRNPDNNAGLPCCFKASTKRTVEAVSSLHYSNPIFDHIREEPENTGEPTKKIPTVIQKPQKKKDLALLRTEVDSSYIADETKYPLNYGTLGKATPALDAYFGQKSSLFASREKMRQYMKPEAHGFIRVGLKQENTNHNNSFFAALAPIIGRNSPDEVIQEFAIGPDNISQVIKPHIYANLNFGNLLLEFFRPSDYSAFITDNELHTTLQHFSNEYLGGIQTSLYPFEIARLYLSYNRFINYILGNDNNYKQYRHFFHILAEKGLFVRNTADETTKKSINGLTIIVLEYNGDPTDPTTEVKVRCPPYGFDMERYEKNDVCFMSVDQNGYWEPLLYVEPVEAGYSQHQAQYRISYEKFSKIGEGALMKNIRKRINEFHTQCSKNVVYRGMYTAQTGIDSSILTPISSIINSFIKNQRQVEGVLRDAYNHLVGVIVNYDPKNQNTAIIIPSSDDGNIRYFDSIKKIYFGFDPRIENNLHQYKTYADATQVYNFYSGTEMEPIRTKNPGYAISSFLAISKPTKKSKKNPINNSMIIGYRLENGVILPCQITAYAYLEIKLGDKMSNVKVETIPYNTEFTFVQDRKIIYEEAEKKEHKTDKDIITREKMEEIYTHFRLTFSNWIRSEDAGVALRKRIHNLIMNRHDISTIKKRQTLTYVLGPMLQSWVFQRDDPDSQETLIRKDCRVIVHKDQCSGHCAWKEDEGHCILHVPTSVEFNNEKITDVAEYFIQRLIYELVNIPLVYNETIEGSIPRVIPLRKNIHIEGKSRKKDQWIIPENVPAWHDLLYSARASQLNHKEKPLFYEEFSDPAGAHDQETTDETLNEVFGPAIASQLVVKKIGEPKTDRSIYGAARDILIYYDILAKADRSLWTKEVMESKTDILSEDLVKNISKLIGGYPVIFIDGTDPSTPQIHYGLKLTSNKKKKRVHIFLYTQNEEGLTEASAIIPYSVLLEYVPLETLRESPIYNTINDAPVYPKKFPTPPPDA